MKALMLATLAVALLLQTAWGKRSRLASLQLQDKLARASEVVFAVTQAAGYPQRSRVARQFDVTCDERTLENFGNSYPPECVSRFQNFDLAGLESGSFTAVAGFVNSFCDANCGQPIVDLLYDCNLPDLAPILVYACRENDNGDRCGAILETLTDTGNLAEANCLPRTVDCSPDCQTSLSNYRAMTGCCGNVTEIVNLFATGVEVEINNAALWDSCGVSVTGLCTRGALRGAGKALTVTKVTFVGLAMLALVVVLLM